MTSENPTTAELRKLAEDALKAVHNYNWVGGVQIGLPNYTTLCASGLLTALDRLEALKAKYEGPFVPIKKAKPGDVLGYSQVVYAGRGKPLRQQLSPEELEDLATEE